MPDLILNLLVASAALNAVASARYNTDARRIKHADYGTPYVITTLLTGLTAIGLWMWLAYSTGTWQFAALIAIPALIAFGSLAARKETNR